MLINTSDTQTIKPFLKDFVLPKSGSHKGQNGKVLIIGGSSLFHSASLWAAEIVAHFVDMVHYSSTEENNEIFLSLKKKFRNGIVVSKKHLLDYVSEDDVILIGPGMIRLIQNSMSSCHCESRRSRDVAISNEIASSSSTPRNDRSVHDYKKIINLHGEAEYTYELTKYLIEHFPEKRFVFDAGVLQMMDPEWLLKLKTPAIITPHQKEFETLFHCSIVSLSCEEKEKIILQTAAKYHCIILLKAIDDIVSDGEKTIIIHGGNQGLTKGGTGDVLAGLASAFYTTNNPLLSAILASILLKKTSDDLSKTMGYWYDIDNLIHTIPSVLRNQLDFRLLTIK